MNNEQGILNDEMNTRTSSFGIQRSIFIIPFFLNQTSNNEQARPCRYEQGMMNEEVIPNSTYFLFQHSIFLIKFAIEIFIFV